MKSTDEQILEAVNGIFSDEQSEKLKIIRAHMDSIETCKSHLESVILNIAEKYLTQINLVLSFPVSALGLLSL